MVLGGPGGSSKDTDEPMTSRMDLFACRAVVQSELLLRPPELFRSPSPGSVLCYIISYDMILYYAIICYTSPGICAGASYLLSKVFTPQAAL